MLSGRYTGVTDTGTYDGRDVWLRRAANESPVPIPLSPLSGDPVTTAYRKLGSLTTIQGWLESSLPLSWGRYTKWKSRLGSLRSR